MFKYNNWGCGAVVARSLCMRNSAKGLGFDPLLLHLFPRHSLFPIYFLAIFRARLRMELLNTVGEDFLKTLLDRYVSSVKFSP
jgi:hypothetical protein